MMLVRQIHAYLTAFVAPSVLFFAFTGALQLFSLHEAHDGYRPPPLVEKLGRLHKDQIFARNPDRARPPLRAPIAGRAAAANGDWVAPLGAHRLEGEHRADRGHQEDGDAPPPSVTALKWLFLASAVMLIVSTLLGLWMALTQNRHRIALLIVLILGAAAPVAILARL